MTIDNLKKDLQSLISGDIEDSTESLDAHSRDTSIFVVRPTLVVYPKTEEDVVALVRYVKEKKASGEAISLTARAAGTCMSGGSLTDSIQVDFMRYFNRVLEVGEGYAITEPGVYYRDFEVKTLEKGYIMPSYPASRELCAIGGILNNNSGGEKTLTYGKTERYVEEVRMVLDDGTVEDFKKLTRHELDEKKNVPGRIGEIYTALHKLLDDNYDEIKNAHPKVSKNSAGYYLWSVYDKEQGTFDIPKLIAGAQGTLGFVTRVKFSLIKPKTSTRMLVIFLKDLKKLPEVVQTVLSYKPESFESYDDHTFKIALKFFPDIAKRMKGNLFSLAIKFIPEFLMAVTGGVPKLILMAEFAGESEDAVDNVLFKAYADVVARGYKARPIHTKDEAKKYWTFRRESFNLLRSKMRGLRTAPFIDDFVVRPELLPEFLPALERILDEYDLTYTVAGHIGDGNFHIIPLMDLSNDASIEIIESLSLKVYDLVGAYEGSITGEHNDGLIRTPFLQKMFSERMLSHFETTKQIFDPQTIFNPHKKVRGDLKYSWSHIDRRHA